MKYVISCLVLVSFYVQNPVHAAQEVSCECPKLGCDPCSTEKGITFFSEKCGPALAKMKSCARPTCIPIDVATKECPVPPSADSGPRTPIVVVDKKHEVAREPAEGANEIPTIGKVKVLSGSVSIKSIDGELKVVSDEASLHEGDSVVSGKESGAVVNFQGGNKLHVQPDSEVQITEFKNQASPETRRALLNLIKGKVRNQVGQKYKGDKQSYYRIQTKGAVAGVRGTDFMASFDMVDGKLDTGIQTLGGKVELFNLDESDKRVLLKGDAVNFVADQPLDASAKPTGKFTDVRKMSADEMRDLDKGTRMDVARAKRKTASESAICDKPRANFNQCMWKCVGNPEGSKVCRTELPQVRCVRSRCNGNGEWAEETRVPAAASQVQCPNAGTLVKDCDY